jgi:hypothetical protein
MTPWRCRFLAAQPLHRRCGLQRSGEFRGGFIFSNSRNQWVGTIIASTVEVFVLPHFALLDNKSNNNNLFAEVTTLGGTLNG